MFNIFAILASTLLFTGAFGDPNGVYCGSYMGTMVTGKVNVKPKDMNFDLAVIAFEKHYSCTAIQYELTKKKNHLIVSDVRDPNSCLGHMLQSNGLTIDVDYDLEADEIKLDLGITTLQLSRC
eukprot:Tbor_TRINITY_DN6145_c0_g4::TRINITY_DN6145_c0_g4_i1::g.21725::m.21725